MELLERGRSEEELHGGIHPSHDGGDVDEVLVSEELRVRRGEDLDGLGAGRLDVGVHAEEADREIVVDLDHLVRVLAVLGDGLGDGSEVELLDTKLHERSAPLDESIFLVSKLT